MTALILVKSPQAQPFAMEVPSEVLVIGSAPHADIQLPGVEEHVATIHFRAGKCIVYNRGQRSLRLNGRRLKPKGSRTWVNGRTLVLDHGIQLVLKANKQAPPLATRFRGLPSDIVSPEPIGHAPFHHTLCFKLIAGGLLLFAAWIGMSLRYGVTPADVTEFEQVLNTWRTPAQSDGAVVATGVAQVMIRRLQQARRDEINGDRKAAYQSYAKLKNYLLHLERRRPGVRGDAGNTTLIFVTSRLATMRHP